MGFRRSASVIALIFFTASCGLNRTGALPPAGGASARPQTGAPAVSLDASSSGPTVAADAYGAEIATWFDFTQPFVNPSLAKTKMGLIRFPGGSESDAYHWENGGTLCKHMGDISAHATFDNLMRKLAKPLGADVAVTLNYGSNRTCDGGGDPAEAGAWVAYAKSHGYRVKYWTVGNENYGSWEYDLHSKPHDPQTYADAVRNDYYPAVKKADPNAQLGVVVNVPHDKAWNNLVLSKAQPFDFVELHYYAEYYTDNDEYLLGQAITKFAGQLKDLRSQMDAANVPRSVPIYLGEYNNDSGEEGKQSVSIVNGLYLGQMLGTVLDAGMPMATWWLAYGSCDEDGDFSKNLYGWQNFGSEALFSDGLPDPYVNCNDTPKIAGGTPFPTARVMAMFAAGVPPGSQVRTVDVAGSLHTRVRAYGFAAGQGFALVLFDNTLNSIKVTANIENSGHSSFDATLSTYGKTQYDQSKQNKWTGPTQKSLGKVGTSVPLTLPPYSVTVLSLQ